MMHIGFDAKRAVRNNTGLGNYSRNLIEILLEYYPHNVYRLFAPTPGRTIRMAKINVHPATRYAFPRGIFCLLTSLWRLWGMTGDIRRSGVEVYHGLSNELPVGIAGCGVRAVVTVHDLIFLRHPAYYRAASRLIYRLKVGYACRHADHIIAASECTKRDIVSFFHVPPSKITVVYQVCDPMYGKQATEARKKTVAQAYRLPPLFALCVGTIEARKNLLLAVKALKGVPAAVHLVAVGRSTSYRREVEACARELGVAPRLHILDNIVPCDLPVIYRLAAVCVYPSFFEGFGIPVIEALTSGTPVIAATGSCLEEAGGPGSVYVDPGDETGLARHITRIVTYKDQAQKMAQAGREYVKRFAPKRIADQLMNVYKAIT